MDELEKQIQEAMMDTPVKFIDTDLYLLCAYHQFDSMSRQLKSLADDQDDVASITLPDVNKDGKFSRNEIDKIIGVEFRAMKDPAYGIILDFRIGTLKMDSANKIFLSSIGVSNWYPADPNEILKIHSICKKLIEQAFSDESQKIRFNMVLMQVERLVEHFNIGL